MGLLVWRILRRGAALRFAAMEPFLFLVPVIGLINENDQQTKQPCHAVNCCSHYWLNDACTYPTRFRHGTICDDMRRCLWERCQCRLLGTKTGIAYVLWCFFPNLRRIHTSCPTQLLKLHKAKNKKYVIQVQTKQIKNHINAKKRRKVSIYMPKTKKRKKKTKGRQTLTPSYIHFQMSVITNTGKLSAREFAIYMSVCPVHSLPPLFLQLMRFRLNC